MDAATFRFWSHLWFTRRQVRASLPPLGTPAHARVALELLVGAYQPSPPLDVAALVVGAEVARGVAGDKRAAENLLRFHEVLVGDRDAQIGALLYAVRQRAPGDEDGRGQALTVARGLAEQFDGFAALEELEKLEALARILPTAILGHPRRGQNQHTFGHVSLEVQRLAGVLRPLTEGQWKARRQKVDAVLRRRFRQKV